MAPRPETSGYGRTIDQLLNVNGVSLLQQSNSEAMETLRRAMLHTEGPVPGSITLTIARRASSPAPPNIGNGNNSANSLHHHQQQQQLHQHQLQQLHSGRVSASSHLTSSSGKPNLLSTNCIRYNNEIIISNYSQVPKQSFAITMTPKTLQPITLERAKVPVTQ